MADLTTQYMGLTLKNPVIAGSSGLTGSIDNIVKLEQSNVGAIVLKSLFEEQIKVETEKLMNSGHENLSAINKGYQDLMQKRSYDYAEALEYLSNFAKEHTLKDYLKFISDVKSAVKIPIIASVNCVFTYDWHSFARRIQDAGADALELNIYILPSDANKTSAENEDIYFNIIKDIKKYVTIPVSIKISYYFSSLSSQLIKLSESGVNGMVLFNRPYSPDIDIEEFKITPEHIFSSPSEYTHTLRWIAILAGRMKCDIAAATGIQDHKAVIKMLLAGATTAQVTSTLYLNGVQHINKIVTGIEDWMNRHNFKTIDDFRGKMSYANIEHPAAYERVQFMKMYSNIV